MNAAMNISVDCDVPLLSADEVTKRIVRLTVSAPLAASGHLLPLNICLALDKSESMSGSKLTMLKQAAISLIRNLRECDMVSVLAFDGSCEIVVPTTTLHGSTKDEIAERITAIRSGNGTALLEAYLRAAGIVADHQNKYGVNEVILVTDGRGNKPSRPDVDELRQHAGKLNKFGVQTSVYGIGEDIMPYYLAPLAVYGGGTYTFLPNVDAAMFRAKESHLCNIVARTAKVQVSAPTGVSLKLLGDIPHNARGGNLTAYIGNMSRGQQSDFYIELLTPLKDVGATAELSSRTTYLDNDGDEQSVGAATTFSYVDHNMAKSWPRDMTVRHGAALVRVGYAVNRALYLAGIHREREAARVLLEARTRIHYLSPEELEQFYHLIRGIETGTLVGSEYQARYYEAYRNQEPRQDGRV